MSSMSFNTLAILVVTATVSLIAPSTATSAPLVNGDFSHPVPLFGWTPTGAILREPTDEFGQLETDGTFQRTLEQGFTLPATPSLLSFDFAFSTQATSAIGGFPDAFAASVITAAGDFLDILVVDLIGVLPDPSDGIEGITGALPIDVDLDPAVTIPGFLHFAGGTSYSGRIDVLLPSAVLGYDATLYFDLFDEPDGAATIAAVDNISVDSAKAVPVPATLGLMLIGLAATSGTHRHKKTAD